jgi:hypothetical protein
MPNQLISGEPTISSVGDVVAEATGSKEAGIAVDLAMVAVDAKNLAKVSAGVTDLIGQTDAAKTVVEAAIEISAPTPKEEKR